MLGLAWVTQRNNTDRIWLDLYFITKIKKHCQGPEQLMLLSLSPSSFPPFLPPPSFSLFISPFLPSALPPFFLPLLSPFLFPSFLLFHFLFSFFPPLFLVLFIYCFCSLRQVLFYNYVAQAVLKLPL